MPHTPNLDKETQIAEESNKQIPREPSPPITTSIPDTSEM